jgi:serine/threonine protein phosphatase PrpC
MKRIKENQDSSIVIDRYLGRDDHMFFGVFDGHGPNGGMVSQHIKFHLPLSLEAQAHLLTEDPFVALARGCLTTNRELLAAAGPEVFVSGSTAITSFLRGNKLFIANVGDSRAVLARTTSGTGAIRAIDLSSDHKPDRPDEQARILSTGGRVFEWGVPRVWLRDSDVPGLAMSRSFGDSAAESVGVFAQPELAEVVLGKRDRFILWASDGVWEFISSQEAVELVWAAVSKGCTPLEAASLLVQESTRRWNVEEDVVDDTTVIVAYLDFTNEYEERDRRKKKDKAKNSSANTSSEGPEKEAPSGSDSNHSSSHSSPNRTPALSPQTSQG